jgi:hypothetical protein
MCDVSVKIFWLAVLAVVLSGCDATSSQVKHEAGGDEPVESSPEERHEDTSGETTMASQKRSQAERCFQPAPDFGSAAAFTEWFQAQAADDSSRRRLRLAVAVSLSDNPLGGVEASVSIAGEDSTHEPVALHLDASSLGVPLPTRLRELCPDDVDRCVVWLDGVAGALVGKERFAPPSDSQARSLTFAVLAVGDRVAQADHPPSILIEAREAGADCPEQ